MSVLKNFVPLCFIGGNLLVSKRYGLYLINLETGQTHKLAAINVPFHKKLLSYIPLAYRFFRLGIHYALPISDSEALLATNNKLYRLNLSDGSLAMENLDFKGSRPLSMAQVSAIKGFEDKVCFGEYFQNFDKASVRIHSRGQNGAWRVAYEFAEGQIDHVHAIIPDKERGFLWILAGDFGDAASIWIAKDGFRDVRPILHGHQIFRGCVGFPTGEGLLYATDSQFEQNSIRLLSMTEVGWQSEKLFDINGPCIYGCEMGGNYYFSTSVEPGLDTRLTFRHWFSRKSGAGVIEYSSQIIEFNPQKGFRIIKKNPKDWWPMILFQFGVIKFPVGKNPTRSLFAYNVALKNNDLSTEIIHIE